MKTIILFLCLFVSSWSIAQEKLYVHDRAVFAENAAVRNATKEQCDLEEYLGKKFSRAISLIEPAAAVISNQTPPDGAAVVNFYILSAQGTTANFLRKNVVIRTEYKVANQIVAIKIATIASGAFVNADGACSNLQKDEDTDATASQIAIWLRDIRTTQIAKSAKDSDSLDIEANRSVNLISPIKYDDDNSVREAIKEECALPSLTEAHLIEQAEREQIAMKPLTSYDNIGAAMRVTIMDAEGTAGGAYSGTKEASFHVELLKDGQVIDRKDFALHTRGGISIRSMATGACRILDKLTRSFSVKAVKWAMEELSIDPPLKKSRRDRKMELREQKKLAEQLEQEKKTDQKEDQGKSGLTQDE
jgi:hypothetical protein